MPFTSADREAVKAAMLAMANGSRAEAVRYSDGSSVTYAAVDLKQMGTMLNLIEQDIAAAAPVLGVVQRRTKAFRTMPRSGF